MQKDQMKIKSTHKNAEIDDFFDKVCTNFIIQ